MLHFPTSIQYHDEHKDKAVLAWHKCNAEAWHTTPRPPCPICVDALVPVHKYRRASPEDLSARV